MLRYLSLQDIKRINRLSSVYMKIRVWLRLTWRTRIMVWLTEREVFALLHLDTDYFAAMYSFGPVTCNRRVHLAEGSNVVVLEQEIRSVELGVCPMHIFHFLITSWKSDDLRYGDISIFKMAAVRHLVIVLPPYETTHEVPVAGRSCLSNFICQSDTQIWRYSCLNFSHIWLEMPIQVPKIGVLGDFGPLTVIIHQRDPQKAHLS